MQAHLLNKLNHNLRNLEMRAAQLRKAIASTSDIGEQQDGFLALQDTNIRLTQIRNTVEAHNAEADAFCEDWRGS